jgi:hypothetical protein
LTAPRGFPVAERIASTAIGSAETRRAGASRTSSATPWLLCCRVTEEQLQVGRRFFASVEYRNGSGCHERTFVVESGDPSRGENARFFHHG